MRLYNSNVLLVVPFWCFVFILFANLHKNLVSISRTPSKKKKHPCYY